MKYFRKHPDLILIANYPDGAHRLRYARLTTPPQLSKILVNTITGPITKTKKILILTDAPANKKRAGWITKTAWETNNPLSFFLLLSRLIYNHETPTICILFHPRLFGRFWTNAFTPGLILMLRLSGKQVVTIFLTTPRLSAQPTLEQTCQYFLQFSLISAMTALTSITVVGEKSFAHKLTRLTGKKGILTIPMTFRTLKERRHAGQILNENLFPSPTQNLGLSHLLKKDSALS
jgi:hypothetical protein